MQPVKRGAGCTAHMQARSCPGERVGARAGCTRHVCQAAKVRSKIRQDKIRRRRPVRTVTSSQVLSSDGFRVLRFHRGCRGGNSVQARALTAPARGAARHARRPWSARCARRPPPFGRPPPPLTRRSQDANSGRHCSTCCHNGHRHWLRGAVWLHQDMSQLREECHITDAAAQNGPCGLCTLCGCAPPSPLLARAPPRG